MAALGAPEFSSVLNLTLRDVEEQLGGDNQLASMSMVRILEGALPWRQACLQPRMRLMGACGHLQRDRHPQAHNCCGRPAGGRSALCPVTPPPPPPSHTPCRRIC